MTPEQTAEAQNLTSEWKPRTVTDAPAQMSEPPSDNDALQQWDDDGNGRISCAEARRHGLAPVHRGHHAYSLHARHRQQRHRMSVVVRTLGDLVAEITICSKLPTNLGVLGARRQPAAVLSS